MEEQSVVDDGSYYEDPHESWVKKLWPRGWLWIIALIIAIVIGIFIEVKFSMPDSSIPQQSPAGSSVSSNADQAQ